MTEKIVVADYDYTGEDETQLTFNEGDRIIVLEEDESGWWTGRLEKNDKEGYFPSTYIKPIEQEKVPPIKIVDSNNKRPQIAPNDNIKTPLVDEEEQKSTNAPPKEGNLPTSASSPDIDYNNYFANAQKIVSVPDDYDGDGDAAGDNYYAAEVLNLKFNPNAKTRFGLAAHYMSLFASVGTIILGSSAFSWSSGSDHLDTSNLANYDLCLVIGLYAFFGGMAIFFWEYLRGDIQEKRSLPLRSFLYFFFGAPLFVVLPTALAGVLWMNVTIFSFLAWKKGETYERKKKRAYSDQKVLTPKERILNLPTAIKQSIIDRYTDIKQQSQLKKYAFVLVYILFNLIFIFERAAFYGNFVSESNDAIDAAIKGNVDGFGNFDSNTLIRIANDNGGSENGIIFSGWFPMAKMFGNLLDVNCSFILFPVCRSFISQLYNISTDQRSTARACSFLLSFMPLDKALQFHKLCAALIAIGTIFHTWAHFNHFAAVPSTYEEVFGPTVWISGSLIIICMHFLYCTSFAAVRHGKFELFWYTHHLFVIFFLSILFHGEGSVNPNFWKWFLLPGILYGAERTLREFKSRQAVGVVSVLHMNNKKARIFSLELEKTGPIRNHQEGQYVFIKAPAISKSQWHPFTISSPPESKNLTLHIRNMGDGSWTDRVQQLFQSMSPGQSYHEPVHRIGDVLEPKKVGPDGSSLICIDGPMAAPTQHLGQYGTSIIVGAGIGVTPVRATLQSIVYFRFKRGIGQTFPDHAYCVWIVNYKQLDAYRFMCRSLKEAEDEMFNLRKKNPKAMEKKLLQVHVFVTSTPKTEKEWEKAAFKEEDVANPDNDPQRDFALWGTHYDELLQYDNMTQRVSAPFTEVDIWKCLKNPSDEPTQIGDIIIHKGRPKWDEFFQPIQLRHTGNKIGVMFCGPAVIARDLKKACGKYTDFENKTVFMLHKENF